MRRARPTAPRVLRAVGGAAATLGLLLAHRAWWLAPVVAAIAASPFLEWPDPPRHLRGLPVLLRLTLLLTFAVLWFSRPVPVLPPETLWLPLAFGSLLALLAAASALAPSLLPPGRTCAPAVVGLMLIAGADPAPPGFPASSVRTFQAVGHNAFAELYLALAAIVVVSLWAAELLARGPSWRGRAAVLVASVALVALVLAAAGVVGLPAAQPKVESAVAEAFQQPATGLSGESTLGEFAGLAVSRRRVLDLWATEAAGSHWLLRSEVLTQFDGRRWTSAPGEGRTQTLVPGAPPPVPTPLLAGLGPWFPMPGGPHPGPAQIRITQHALDTWPLLLPAEIAAVTADASYLELDSKRLVRRTPGAAVALYGAVLASSAVPVTPLEEAEAARDLAVPSGLDARVRALAAELSSGPSKEEDRVERTLRHLRTRCRYTLQPGPFRPGGDPVAEFLFEKKRGYCEYFASAAVLLLRLQGIPARFAKGLSVGPQDDYGGGLFVVREANAHAWAEAYLQGRGWIEVDPTPPADFAAAHPGPDTLDRWLERLRAALAEAWTRLTGPGLVSFLRWAGDGLAALGRALVSRPWVPVALVLALASPRLTRWIRARYRQRRREHHASSGLPLELRQAVADLERRWRLCGRPRPPSRGLREHAAALASSPSADGPAPSAEAVHELLDVYYRARFGGQPPDPAALGRLRAALQTGRKSRTGARPGA